MTQYVAFLRGINVGGYRPLKMKELREMFASAGFQEVSTYIQSGNVIFHGDKQKDDSLASQIHQQIKNTFGYDVPVFIRTLAEVDELHHQFPFEDREGWTGYVTFLRQQLSQEQAHTLLGMVSPIEQFQIQDHHIYSFIDKKTKEKPRFSNGFIEKKFDQPTTTRNLRTLSKIIDLANK